MYQNSLHELIDAEKKSKVFTSSTLTDEDHKRANRIVSLIPQFCNAVCFKTTFESVPDIKVDPFLLRLPFEHVWFEVFDGETLTGFFCGMHKERINLFVFVKTPEKEWFFVGDGYIDTSEGDYFSRICCSEPAFLQRVQLLARYLSALNCCNIKRTEYKPKPSQQSVRRALGRHPLFSTWTLEIDLQRTEQEMPGQGGTHASPRLHLRRGHARQHRPGQWCWVQPHVVGDKSLGMIHKDYATH